MFVTCVCLCLANCFSHPYTPASTRPSSANACSYIIIDYTILYSMTCTRSAGLFCVLNPALLLPSVLQKLWSFDFDLSRISTKVLQDYFGNELNMLMCEDQNTVLSANNLLCLLGGVEELLGSELIATC